MEDLIGKELGSYRIVQKIGHGGMAVVYKAYQASLDRDVALKVLPPTFAAQDPNFIKRFEREARSIARLHDPHILPVYDFGVQGDYSYIVMRYVEGGRTLMDLMHQTPPTQEQTINLISQIAKALAYAHKQGVIHRDIKPSNILIDNGWILLSDFGLAKVSEATSQLTKSRISMGTPAYMSPEQSQGGAIDHRTDIYALGVILYQMLTGVIPHKADTPWAILSKRANEPPIPPGNLNPSISKSIEQVTLRSLATKPEHRYALAEDFEEALQKAAVDESYRETLTDPVDETTSLSIPYAPEPSTQIVKRQPRDILRNPIWAIITIVALAGLLIFVGIVIGSGGTITSQSTASPASSTSEVPLIVEIPTSTDTPTATPTQRPTNTPILPTPTPAFTAEPTNTPVPAPPAPTQTSTVTPPPATPTPTNTPSPTDTPAPPTATPTITPTPTLSIPSGTFVLLSPADLDKPSFGPTEFEWQWAGTVPSDMGFEVSVWREGEPQAGVHDAVLDNKEGNIQFLGDNKYRLMADITDAPGVQRRSGEYWWTVSLVQISPDYANLGQQATPTLFRFELPGGPGGGGDGGSGSGGAVIK